ncbi:MAG: oxidoreductase [Deferrisomatales bacterium]
MYEVFEPVPIGPLTARNRLVRSATWLGLSTLEGEVTDAQVHRYAELAAGGAGTIVTGYASVSPEGRQMPRMLGAHDDAFVPGLRRLAQAIRGGGALAGLQIVHAGGQTRSEWIGGRTPVAPSFVPSPQYPEMPRELTADEIARVVADFGQAARRAREAGFDFVQLHAAHGYLVNQFLSPATNQRSDRYGGDLRHRFRFLQEVIAAAQGAAGADFPVAIKLSGCDFVPGGFEVDDAGRVAEWLELRGLAFIEVSGGTPASGDLGPVRAGAAAGQGEAYLRDLAVAVKRRVGMPIALVGGLRRLETLEDLLLEGAADLFSLSRPLIWEPGLPRRWAAGDRGPARCIGCNGCFGPARAGEGARCIVRDAAPAPGPDETPDETPVLSNPEMSLKEGGEVGPFRRSWCWGC